METGEEHSQITSHQRRQALCAMQRHFWDAKAFAGLGELTPECHRSQDSSRHGGGGEEVEESGKDHPGHWGPTGGR